MGSPRLLVAYRTPSALSTARVAAWRGMHGLGGLFLGPTVCLLPAALADARQLEAIAGRVRAGGGSFELLPVESFAEEAERSLRGRYKDARDAEYAEIVERADSLIEELEREGSRGRFTFAEVEENEADLAKLQRWLRRVRTRDLSGAGAGSKRSRQSTRQPCASKHSPPRRSHAKAEASGTPSRRMRSRARG